MAILLLAATAAVGAGQSNNETNTTASVAPYAEEVRIDPAIVHQAILDGEAFDLPVPNGSVEVQATERTQEMIRYQNAAGEEVIVRPPNVWKIDPTDGPGEGVVLSFNHTLHAWLETPAGDTYVEPLNETVGPTVDKVYRLIGTGWYDSEEESSEDDSFGTTSHIQVYTDLYAYVDTQYRDQYGSCCWADQVAYILGLLNGYFDDVQVEYRYCAGTVDGDFNTNDLDTAWDTLVNKPYNGCHVKSYWTFRDFDGCEVGRASFPGSIMITQHESDACHLDQRPSSDAQRAYLTAHELGKNNNAHPDYHWSETTVTGHEHRSIMDPSVWGHYHGCWSQTNLNRMASYWGTSVTESPC